MDLRTRRRPVAWLTVGVSLLAAALWIRAAAAPPTLPDLPRSPITMQTWLMRPVPPPPPPPPPPPADRDAARRAALPLRMRNAGSPTPPPPPPPPRR